MDNKFLWGIGLLILGAVLLLNALHITDVNLLFEGWWTLFIIIPCGNRLLNDHTHWVAPFIGLLVGVLLLLHCQHVFRGYFSAELVIAIAVILAGGVLLFTNSAGGGKSKKKRK